MAVAPWVVAAILTANLCWLVYKGVTPVRAASPVYTVVRTEKAFDKIGNLRYTIEYTDAVRRDGAVALIIASSVDHQRRIGFPSGNGVVINELIGKKSTYPRNFPGLRIYRDPNTSCSGPADTNIGIVLEGVDYIGTHRTIRFKHVTESGTWKAWYAPDVGCALLQSRLEHDGGVTVQELTSLTLDEPNKALFEVADSLQETPPSGLFVPKCLNGKCDSVPDAVKVRRDKNYFAAREQTP